MCGKNIVSDSKLTGDKVPLLNFLGGKVYDRLVL